MLIVTLLISSVCNLRFSPDGVRHCNTQEIRTTVQEELSFTFRKGIPYNSKFVFDIYYPKQQTRNWALVMENYKITQLWARDAIAPLASGTGKVLRLCKLFLIECFIHSSEQTYIFRISKVMNYQKLAKIERKSGNALSCRLCKLKWLFVGMWSMISA